MAAIHYDEDQDMTNHLEIPSFLDRKITPRATAINAGSELPTEPIKVERCEPSLPKGNWELYHLHLADELPRIGSGHRLVYANVGRKWVRVRARNGEGRCRVLRSLWNVLPGSAGPVISEPIDAGSELPTESTDQGDQYIEPALCGGPVTDRDRIETAMAKPMAAAAVQAACNVGMFDEAAQSQMSLF